MNKNIPAISIIIPMYNVEKYVGECLDSILAQTFQDYEVIIVDDCSTDNSCVVVESYLPKFNAKGGGAKARLIRSKVNSDLRPAIPRNLGLSYACGKYIYYMDSDDALLSEALDLLYSTAEKFEADVVNTNWIYKVNDDCFTEVKNHLYLNAENTTNRNLKKDIIFNNINKHLLLNATNTKRNLEPPEQITADVNTRIKMFIKPYGKQFRWECWDYLIRREFLIENDITFPEYLSISDDVTFLAQVICLAKKIIKISDSFYVYRQRSDSHFRSAYPIQKQLRQKCRDMLGVIKFFEEFADKINLKLEPEIKYLAFNSFFYIYESILHPIYAKIPAYLLDDIVREVIDSLGNNTAMTAYLFSRLNIADYNLSQMHLVAKNLSTHIQNQNKVIWSQQKKIFELQRQLENKK